MAAFPTIAHISRYDIEHWGEYWRFTGMGAEKLFRIASPPSRVKVQAYGNVLIAMAFLHGLLTERLTKEELAYHDLDYEVLVAVRAVKPKDSVLSSHKSSYKARNESRTGKEVNR